MNHQDRAERATVQARMELRNDAVRAAGLERIIINLTADVQGGKITNWRAVNDTSDPMTAQWVALMATQPNPIRLGFANLKYLSADALPITLRVTGARRTLRPFLAKWQIVADDGRRRSAKGVRQRYQ